MTICVVFDFDGTMVDTPHHYAWIFNTEVADRHKCKKVRAEDVDLLRAMSTREVLRFLNITWLKLPAVVRDMKREVNKHVQDLPLVKGIRELVISLKDQGYRLGIITTNSEENVREWLEHHDLELFDHLLCDTNVISKGRSIKSFSKRFCVAKKNMLYIGDEARDIHSSKKTGIAVVAVPWGYHTGERLKTENPDFFVNRPEDILDVVEEFQASRV